MRVSQHVFDDIAADGASLMLCTHKMIFNEVIVNNIFDLVAR